MSPFRINFFTQHNPRILTPLSEFLCVSVIHVFYCRVVSHGGGGWCPGLLNHPSIEGHESCFQFGSILNKAAMNICAQVLYDYKFLFLWERCTNMQLPGCMVIVCLVLQETAKSGCFSLAIYELSSMSKSSQNLLLLFLFLFQPF